MPLADFTLVLLQHLAPRALQAAGFTLFAIVLLLLVLFREKRAVVYALVGTTIGTPCALAVMALVGLPITLVSAALPTLLLMVGVADAVHLLTAFSHRRGIGMGPKGALRSSFVELLFPCVLTTATTAAGYGHGP